MALFDDLKNLLGEASSLEITIKAKLNDPDVISAAHAAELKADLTAVVEKLRADAV